MSKQLIISVEIATRGFVAVIWMFFIAFAEAIFRINDANPFGIRWREDARMINDIMYNIKATQESQFWVQWKHVAVYLKFIEKNILSA